MATVVEVPVHAFSSVECAELVDEVQADNIDVVLRKMKVAVRQGVWMEAVFHEDKHGEDPTINVVYLLWKTFKLLTKVVCLR